MQNFNRVQISVGYNHQQTLAKYVAKYEKLHKIYTNIIIFEISNILTRNHVLFFRWLEQCGALYFISILMHFQVLKFHFG